MAVAHICTMVPVAQAAGSRWIVEGKGVLHPLGDPSLSGDEERALRRATVKAAIASLSELPEGQAG